jgi:hypothetical protein
LKLKEPSDVGALASASVGKMAIVLTCKDVKDRPQSSVLCMYFSKKEDRGGVNTSKNVEL